MKESWQLMFSMLMNTLRDDNACHQISLHSSLNFFKVVPSGKSRFLEGTPIIFVNEFHQDTDKQH